MLDATLFDFFGLNLQLSKCIYECCRIWKHHILVRFFLEGEGYIINVSFSLSSNHQFENILSLLFYQNLLTEVSCDTQGTE
jgi:hypothetical protein